MKTSALNLIIVILFGLLYSGNILRSQTNALPMIGAQVFIEPGQTKEDIDTWFRILDNAGMKVCRIRMFEAHMHLADGSWDYSLYDEAFRAAEKYDIKIFATLFPADSKNSVGGEKFPESEEHFTQITAYVKNMAEHFRHYKSLFGWVLQNEPGTGGSVPDNDFTREQFKKWKASQVVSGYTSKGYMTETFGSKRFLVDYETWYLGWIASEIRKYDKDHYLHVNNHQIFENVAEYDFPSWRKFLTTLGASAHASWHFGYFTRDKYSVALAANCDIIRSGSGNLPYWITELQGGNNIWSGNVPMCPTAEEITQWLWTGIMSGAKGIIFWTLNPRGSADEAGEWAMITLQNEPSDRLRAASEVINILNTNSKLLSNAVPVERKISILYSRESLWAESRSQMGGQQIEGRERGGVMKSALSFYETLSENGIGCNFSEINEFDWNKDDYTGNAIILAHQISIPSNFWSRLENFVSKGGRLIVSGLTGFFDENMHNVMKTGFPGEKLFGGTISEFRYTGDKFEININSPDITLPAHWMQGIIKNNSSDVIGKSGEEITAARNCYGKGEVVWIPSMIGLGARRGSSEPLSGFLKMEVANSITCNPVSLKKYENGILMRTMKSDKSYLSVLINKNPDTKNLELSIPDSLKASIIFSNKSGNFSSRNICTIHPEETLIIRWDQDHLH